MANGTRYTWTISVIAIYNEHEPALKVAYDEFEGSIKKATTLNKDINFVIFFYDSNSEKAEVRKTVITDGILEWKIIPLGFVDIYEPSHKVLITFFSEHVSRDKIEADEEHKHFLITWGHGAGLGFMKQEIERKISEIQGREMLTRDTEVAHSIGWEDIYTINLLRSSLNLPRVSDGTRSEGGNDLNSMNINEIFNEEKSQTDVAKLFRIISSGDLAKIIRGGLVNDKSIVRAVKSGVETGPLAKIQVMLCLTCYVNMVETAYALKDVVNVYIAPQTEINFAGYNYNELFYLLGNHPEADEIQISENITHYYLTKYLDEKIRKQAKGSVIFEIDYKSDVSFSAVYLSFYDRIAKKIRQFRDFIEAQITSGTNINGKGVDEVLRLARDKCLTLAGQGTRDVGIIDLENYITEILSNFRGSALNNFRRFYSFDQIISDYCPGSLCRSLYTAFNKFQSRSPGSYSVFLPNNPISPVEAELIGLFKQMETIPGSFAEVSGWSKIINIVLS